MIIACGKEILGGGGGGQPGQRLGFSDTMKAPAAAAAIGGRMAAVCRKVKVNFGCGGLDGGGGCSSWCPKEKRNNVNIILKKSVFTFLTSFLMNSHPEVLKSYSVIVPAAS
jgi:hypothetical protein